jgi:hypothetical protein
VIHSVHVFGQCMDGVHLLVILGQQLPPVPNDSPPSSMTASSHITALRLQPIVTRFTNAPENGLRNGEKTSNVGSPIAWVLIGFSRIDSLRHALLTAKALTK